MGDFRERLEAARKARSDSEYAELRERDPGLFRECVQTAQTIVLNRPELGALTDEQRLSLTAEIEQELVSIAARAGRDPGF